MWLGRAVSSDLGVFFTLRIKVEDGAVLYTPHILRLSDIIDGVRMCIWFGELLAVSSPESKADATLRRPVADSPQGVLYSPSTTLPATACRSSAFRQVADALWRRRVCIGGHSPVHHLARQMGAPALWATDCRRRRGEVEHMRGYFTVPSHIWKKITDTRTLLGLDGWAEIEPKTSIRGGDYSVPLRLRIG